MDYIDLHHLAVLRFGWSVDFMESYYVIVELFHDSELN